MSSKKIFFLSVMNGGAWGGSEELWYQSALWCTTHEITTAACCFDWPEKINRIDKLEKAGCKLYLLPGKQEKTSLLNFSKPAKLLSAIPFEEYDLVIINQGGWKDVVYPPVRNLFKRIKNYVLLYHNYNIDDKLSAPKQQLLQQWVDGALQNFAASLKIFEVMKETYNLSVQNQQKLFNPLTIEIANKPEPYPPLQNGNLIFSVLAALDIERKAQDILIRALSDPAWQERNWELHLYGQGKDKETLHILVARLHMKRKIFIHGLATDYREAIRKSHLVLQLTHIDAMPITVIEAMSMARPVAVSAVGDMPTWIEDEVSGFVCRQVNTESILQTMEKAWNARAQWQQLGKKGFQTFKTDFPEQPVQYFLKQCNII